MESCSLFRFVGPESQLIRCWADVAEARMALALVAQPKQPLATVANFYGSGVYAIYYRGSFAAYAPLANTESLP